VRTTLIVLILLLSVAGCGYKGPLYLPKDKPVAAKPAPVPPAAKPAAEPETPAPSP
jgi:predicted small lipoprotein YifL